MHFFILIFFKFVVFMINIMELTAFTETFVNEQCDNSQSLEDEVVDYADEFFFIQTKTFTQIRCAL